MNKLEKLTQLAIAGVISKGITVQKLMELDCGDLAEIGQYIIDGGRNVTRDGEVVSLSTVAFVIDHRRYAIPKQKVTLNCGVTVPKPTQHDDIEEGKEYWGRGPYGYPRMIAHVAQLGEHVSLYEKKEDCEAYCQAVNAALAVNLEADND